jgi:hypothetical protein
MFRTTTVVTGIAVCCVLSFDIRANLITNGNFESGAVGFSSDYLFSPVTGVPAGVFAVVNSPFPWHEFGPTFPDHTSGSGLMHLSNGSADINHRVWYNSISVVAGQTYTFSFWAASWGNNGGVDPSVPRVRVEVNSQQIGSDFAVQATNGVWTQWSGAWTAAVSGTVVLSIRNLNADAFGNDLALDDLVLVPGPARECPGDLNGDLLVDDSDFSIFVIAYDILDCDDPAMPVGCPADLNKDGVVDDADFSIFAIAYESLLCP